jgi:hypothetical protein
MLLMLSCQHYTKVYVRYDRLLIVFKMSVNITYI